MCDMLHKSFASLRVSNYQWSAKDFHFLKRIDNLHFGKVRQRVHFIYERLISKGNLEGDALRFDIAESFLTSYQLTSPRRSQISFFPTDWTENVIHLTSSTDWEKANFLYRYVASYISILWCMLFDKISDGWIDEEARFHTHFTWTEIERKKYLWFNIFTRVY